MKPKSSLEQEYKNLMNQTTPDLWARIERNLNEHPERVSCREAETISFCSAHRRMFFGTAVAAAAVFLALLAGPWYSSLFSVRKNTVTTESVFDGFDAAIAAETTAETTQYTAREDNQTTAGVLHYSQLNLVSYCSLTLPDQAVTLPEDTMYFSEEVLEDTELVCLGTVTSVSMEMDSHQNVSSLVYDICLDEVCYSADYTAGLEHITVKSPIIGAEGGGNQILYQLQAGASYLLPLKKQEGSWELLFAFAPQIQVTGDGAYLFHSGYTSLTDHNTFVVIGEQEGTNDYYYDRMLLREDEDFLSDYITLVMQYIGGKV